MTTLTVGTRGRPIVVTPRSVMLGQDSSDGETEAKFYNILGQLRQGNQELQALEAQELALLNAGTPDAEFAQDVMNVRNQYYKLVEAFMPIYRAVFGDVPSGLTGVPRVPLGALGVTWPVAAAITLAAIAIGLLVFWELVGVAKQKLATIQTQADTTKALVQAATQQANNLQNQAAVADAQGDYATASQLRTQAQTLMQDATQAVTGGGGGVPAQSLGDWLKAHWFWVAAGGAGLAVAAKVL